jgi:putative DNA primase/helicase
MSRELAERCKGRWPDILRRLGLLSSAALAGKDVPCPMCGGHDRFRLSDKGYGRWFCRGCGMGGDGVRLVMAIKRVDFALAAAMIESVVGKVSYASAASGASSGASHASASDAPKDPMKPWRNAGPFIRNSPVDIYLKNRGLDVTDDEARSLRFSAAQWHWQAKTRWPAMVARVALATGEDITSHMTFIEPDGSGKAELEKPRLFAAGGKTIGGGVWFGQPDPEREFIVAEGIETLLSGLRIFGVTAGCAALSEGGVRTLILPPEARLVRIFPDNDELGQSFSAARDASRRWRSEGRTVRATMSETVGEDANNVLLTRLRKQKDEDNARR